MNESLGNRRKFSRVSFEVNFELKTGLWSDPSAKGLDISLNGCRFNCEQLLSEDDKVSLYLSSSLVLKGIIIWCWPIEWYYTAAVYFENITEKEQEQLKYYIEEVTGEKYQMEKEEENSKGINENLYENNIEIDSEDEEEDEEEIDDINFDVLGEDQNEDDDLGYEIEDLQPLDEKELQVTNINEEEDDILSEFSEEDLDNKKNESKKLNSSLYQETIQNENSKHEFAEDDFNPLSFKGRKVVIFGMEKKQAEILTRYLSERLGMEIDFVTKKQNLWRHLKIDSVNLIILESGSGNSSDALEVMQQTEDQFPGVNYFCISGPVSLERRMQFLNAGALDYLVRPIHLSSIAQSILIHLSRMDFYKKEAIIEQSKPENNSNKYLKQNLHSNETFHDEDLTETLDLTEKDIDLSREIELVDEDF
tara:strand:+ start:2985 stop:4247 length:1263 start_codon:yes stop_codon:yes gene_type:complete